MSRLRKNLKSGGAGAALLPATASLCLLAWAFPIWAQETGALRGPLVESEINAVLLPGAQGKTARKEENASSGGPQATPDYQPASAGAISEQDEDTGAPGQNDAFSDDSGLDGQSSGPQRTLSTARERQNARKQAALPQDQRTPQPVEGQRGPGDIETASQSPADLQQPVRPVESVGSIGSEATRLENLPAGANERTLRRDEEDPFAPVGLRLGRFNVVPTLEQGLTTTTNVDSSPEGGSAMLSETTLRLNAVSDWARNSATIDAHGTYRKSISGDDYSEFEGVLNSRLELDIRSGLRGIATFDYTIRPENASSPVEIANVQDRPLRQVVGGSLGAEKDIGKIRLGLTGNVVRDQYGDATLSDGTTLSQDDRNNTLIAATLRSGYALSPALTPFVEAELGRRIYDRTIDASGYERSATRTGLRAGVELDLREKLSGEISAGWISEDADDDRLETISGPTLAASLLWSPLRGTTVRLDGATTIENTTDVGESGSILYSGLLSGERRIRDNLTGTAALGLGWRRYDLGGRELTLSAQAALTWWLNRNLGITGRARHERLQSDLPGRDYDVSSLFLGVKLQR